MFHGVIKKKVAQFFETRWILFYQPLKLLCHIFKTNCSADDRILW